MKLLSEELGVTIDELIFDDIEKKNMSNLTCNSKEEMFLKSLVTQTAKTFANIITVRTGDENREEIKILDEVIPSQKVKDFINEKYKGTAVPVF
ncbi:MULTISPECIES: MetQ/NlpA family ABC transporter substrate-binding protein [Clostridium]|uniref:MetQ/NlpA family ABC transporter substrate-binding protein n=1 Tax=Clostridium TaxID=1485 RepID=UPI000983C799|nr:MULTISPECIES: MetQ/NlpA family ABC transporter substrate-binding protein [Clostridium]AQR97496.1 methionine-binding lipoprotein MetQ precursor [Clostridium saccharoperbutylacetonicum]NSB33380.1 ABC-type metal ion transport system substrate-binding protein [Clostridium saccharoperbutylacetonicum]